MTTLTVITCLLISSVQLTHVNGIWCYECAVTGEPWDTCEETIDTGECAENHYCSKMLRKDGTVIRGCASKQTAMVNKNNEIGCWKTKSSHKYTKVIETCFCDIDFCNFAPAPKSIGLLILLIALSTLLF